MSNPHTAGSDGPSSVRIPADVDRDDVLVAGLTARQLGMLAAAGAGLVGLWAATRGFLPAPVFAVAVAPIGAVAVVLVTARRDGLPADRLALAALRHARSTRRLVPAPDGVPALPPEVRGGPLPAPLDVPIRDVAPDGVLDLAGAGRALICRASSVNFGLRTAAEQRGLVAVLGRWLNSLTEPVQIVVRAERVAVAAAVAALCDRAPSLSSMALETAALDHAGFLGDLAARRDVLRRAVLVVFHTQVGDKGGGLARRAADATSALAAAGIILSPLPEAEARVVLANAMDADGASDLAGLGATAGVVSGGWE